MRNYTELLSAQAGTILLNDTSTYTGTVHKVVVLEDTVFDTLTDSKGNVKGGYIKAPATPAKKDAFFTPFDRQHPFSSIKLTSGSVLLIL
jgi:hypothetical protein